MHKSLMTAALAGVLAAGVAQAHNAVVPDDKEKCYGIAKAKKNDCGSSDRRHTCAGQAAKDNDPTEWKFVKKGECTKLNGKLEGPKA